MRRLQAGQRRLGWIVLLVLVSMLGLLYAQFRSWTEALLVLAERARDAAPDDGIAERIRSAVLEHTGIRPHTVRLLEPGTLPRTSSGKLRRGEALRRFLAGQLTPPRAAGPARLATEAVRSALAFARAKAGRGR